MNYCKYTRSSGGGGGDTGRESSKGGVLFCPLACLESITSSVVLINNIKNYSLRKTLLYISISTEPYLSLYLYICLFLSLSRRNLICLSRMLIIPKTDHLLCFMNLLFIHLIYFTDIKMLIFTQNIHICLHTTLTNIP